jgi:hypothetical protein
MNRPTTSTRTKTSVIMPGQRTTTKEPAQKRNITPQVICSPKMTADPRLDYHRGTRGLSSTVSLNSLNSTTNIKKGTISSKHRTNNITDTQREENSPQNAPIWSPITDPDINDNNENIIDTQREENSPHAPIRRTLRTRTTTKKQTH